MVDTGESAAWTWHQDPRAFYDGERDVTVIGYVDSSGSVRVLAHDHTSGKTVASTIRRWMVRDDHVSPSFYVRPDGQYQAFYARQQTYLRQQIATETDSITRWDNASVINDANWNYPNPAGEFGGITYLFARQNLYNQYIFRSNDGGDSWGSSQQLTDFSDHRAYLKTARDGDLIYCSLQAPSFNSTELSDLYAIYLDTTDNSIYEVGGSQLTTVEGAPLTEADLTAIDSSTTDDFGAQRVFDIQIVGGNPRILYADVDDPSNHIYREARFDGSSWSTEEIVQAGPNPSEVVPQYYSGGLCYDPTSTDVVYMSVETTSGAEIRKATRQSAGDWTTEDVTSGTSRGQWRPMRVFDGTSELPVAWLAIDSWADFEHYEMELQLPTNVTPVQQHQRPTYPNGVIRVSDGTRTTRRPPTD